MHEAEAWSVANLSVQIGSIIKTGYPIVDKFNQVIMDVFNLASGNMLQYQNVLSWNVWFRSPQLVDQGEWARHAWVWRESIDAGHGSPAGEGASPRYFNGDPLNIDLDEIKKEEKRKILDFLTGINGEEKDKITAFFK